MQSKLTVLSVYFIFTYSHSLFIKTLHTESQPEKKKDSQVLAPNQEAICKWYLLGREDPFPQTESLWVY